MNDHEYIADLLQKETLSDGEIEFLAARNAHDPSDPLWETAAEQFVIRLKDMNGRQPSEKAKQALEKILQQLGKARETATAEETIAPVHRIHFLKTAWFKYAAAILLITGVGIYYVIDNPKPDREVVQTTPPSVPAQDALPGTDRAILTLSNGEKVELNNATSETITDGTLSIKNNNGQLVYDSERGSYPPSEGAARSAGGGPGGGSLPAGRQGAEARTATNTMSTPRGGQYKLTLSDGTDVWLNAASSITYPTAFKGKKREVSVTGEAYFEVAKNKEKPFIVTVATPYPPLAEVAAKRPEVDRERSERTRTFPETATYRIEVLGTSFNVNSYPDESTIKTSLAQGSVKVNNVILKPNQAFTNGKVTPTNIAQDIAWKNGAFNFTDTDLKKIFRQLARWYDVEIRYEGKLPDKQITGKMGRDLTLAQVLKSFKGMGISTRLENKTLIVLSD